ncbi:hypothetical protein Leryth_005844 [Lithospermum erythrorhizon]|nr:hypothetical protein Leryth_005844 [Lithospermum erythrorhizon]
MRLLSGFIKRELPEENDIGVTCDNGGQVIAIHLSYEGVSGALNSSSSLFDLQHLRSLNLAANNFNSSEITPAFGKLVNLVHLNLSTSGFSGQIPIEIAHLTKLLALDLSTVGSSGVLKLENPNFTLFVQNLTVLEELHLGGVNISYKGSELFRAVARSLLKLKVLSLHNCFLSGPTDWSYLLRLKSLS